MEYFEEAAQFFEGTLSSDISGVRCGAPPNPDDAMSSFCRGMQELLDEIKNLRAEVVALNPRHLIPR